MPNVWSAYTSWTEVCQRASGRRKYHSLRRLHARLRRQQVAQHLRCEGLGYGVRARLARTLGVSKATITSDVRAILAMPESDCGGQRQQGGRRASETGQEGQRHRVKGDTMSQRYTFRLPDDLHEYVQIEADARQCSTSDVIREALGRLLGLTSDRGAESTPAPEPASRSTAHDCTETVMTRLPMDVREGIAERARLLDLPVSKVVTAMLIAKLPPSQTASTVSGTARPQTESLTWQEFKRRR
jgi:Arc/MetJ-type ribon-helix-helix transcriptional regulator